MTNLLIKNGEAPQLDGLGSMRQGLSTSSGQFTGQADYSAFGESIGGNNPGAFQSVYQWGAQSGYRSDGSSGGGGDCGLVKVGARYYDPAVGRFTTRDTDLSQLPYVYCSGDPLDLADPTGMGQVVAALTLVGAILGGAVAVAFAPEIATVGVAYFAVSAILGILGGTAGGAYLGSKIEGRSNQTAFRNGIEGGKLGFWVGLGIGVFKEFSPPLEPIVPRSYDPPDENTWPPPPTAPPPSSTPPDNY